MTTSDGRRRVAVVLVDRANYGRLKPVMSEIAGHPGLELVTVAAGTMLLDRFGTAVNTVRADGFGIDAEVYVEIEGSSPVTMAKSVGIAVMEFASAFNSLHPDIVLVIGDRYEALAATIAASYQNMPVAHVQGGEVSGSIDESARHAITKLSHFHFPSTARSADYLVRMGEDPGTVFRVGCPSGDVVFSRRSKLSTDVFEAGVGAAIDAHEQFLFVLVHPVTTHYGTSGDDAAAVLGALDELRMPTVWLWPNIDAGSDQISEILRRYREQHNDSWLRLMKGFPPDVFESVLDAASVAIGNSSGFVRDSSFLGTPVVLVGDRQQGREHGPNAMEVPADSADILVACRQQLDHGDYPPSVLYGDGKAAPRIAARLAEVELFVQKQLHYVNDSSAGYIDLLDG